MNATMMVCDEVVETIPVDCRNEPTPHPLLTAPTVKFISKENAPKLYHDCGDGKRCRLSPAEIARHSTGIDRTTGQRTLGIGIRNRHNGTVRFESDVWKLPFDFHPDALSLLAGRWQRENAAMPNRMLRQMERYFCGRTSFMFDVMSERVCDWRNVLAVVLGRDSSYIDIASVHRRNVIAGTLIDGFVAKGNR